MRIAIAYISVVLLWATTPLTIKWSGEGPGFLFGVTSRMVIGMVCLGILLLITRQGLKWERKAWLTYFSVSLQCYGSLTAVYWSAQHIPSGWISVLFGLTPLLTALLAALCFGQRDLSFSKVCSYLLGVGGLVFMFGSALELGREAVFAIAAVVGGSCLHSFSALWIKRIDAGLPALVQVSGGLLVSLPVYLLTWSIFDGEWPKHLTQVNVISIVYLGVIATAVGFVLYYYLLTRLPATRVALITLIAPVLALWLGHAANREPITPNIVAGSAAIFCALLLHEYAGVLFAARRRIRANAAGSRRASRRDRSGIRRSGR